jgi:histidyl-tRNA synthetase
MTIVYDLRREGLHVDMDYQGRSMKGQFKSADAKKAAFALIMGGNEVDRGVVAVKDFATGQQVEVEQAKLAGHLKNALGREL